MSSPGGRRWGWPVRGLTWIDALWVVFAAANLVAMQVWGSWEPVPFHFIWVSVTLLYGFRVWSGGTTAIILGSIVVSTALGILQDVQRGAQPLDELTEVPLMSAMFLAMVWHAQRRRAALQEARTASEHNVRLLERERRFVQDASHVLKTPITIALGHADLLQRSVADGGQAEDVAVIREELLRLRSLVERLLLTVSAPDDGGPDLATVEFRELVASAFRRWSVTPRRWRMESGPPVWVEGDERQLRSAVDVLLENALQHTSERDMVEVRLQARESQALLFVSDTGPGIDPSDVPRVFERFGRADGARGRGGFGLGLAIARSVAEAHGGTVTVRSTPGQGATFELRLPLALAPGLPSLEPLSFELQAAEAAEPG